MHIWRHPSTGNWYAKRPDGTRTSLRTKDKQQALSRLEDLKRAPSSALICEAMRHYLVEKADKPSRPQMEIAWKWLQPHFGHLRHDQVTRKLCREYIDTRQRNGVKPATIARELCVLKTAVRYSHPASNGQWEIPPAAAPRDRRLTKAEFKALLEACDVFHVRLFIVLALSTGARRSALLQLTWDRVDFERRLIDLRLAEVKGKGRAIVPMTDMAYTALLDARDLAQSDHVIEYAGRPVGSVKRGFARAVREAGLRAVTPHTLRHTAASWMAEAGVNMSEIAAFLGHRDSRITERVYAKFSPGYLSKAAEALHI